MKNYPKHFDIKCTALATGKVRDIKFTVKNKKEEAAMISQTCDNSNFKWQVVEK